MAPDDRKRPDWTFEAPAPPPDRSLAGPAATPADAETQEVAIQLRTELARHCAESSAKVERASSQMGNDAVQEWLQRYRRQR